MMITLIRFILLFLFCSTPLAFANPIKLEHTTATLISDINRIQPGKPFWIALKLALKPEWHTYWMNPGDSGLATTIEWTLPTGFIASPIHWIAPHWLQTKQQITFGYANEAFYLVEITPTKEISAQPQTLTAQANWLACGESCVPESAEISLTLPVTSDEGAPDYGKHHALIHQLKDELPQQLTTTGEFNILDETVQFTVLLNDEPVKQIDSVLLFPTKNGLINYHTPLKFSLENNLLTITAAKGKNPQLSNYETLLQFNDKTTHKIYNYCLIFTQKQVTAPIHTQEALSLITILAFALLGGFILNAMPCVFPILSIKALTITKKKKSEFKKIRAQGFMYTIGVIVSFLSLAFLLIALKKGGHSIGWGFQMQSPYFVTFMIYLTFLIGLSLSGLFYMPIFFGNANAAIEEGRKRDSFLLGILAVLVATPCTAPFMGVAIGYALTQSALTIIIVFVMLALGFAIPYLMICLFPALLKLLPKSGPWMETFKESLAFPMYATVLWLLWVLVQQSGSRALISIGSGLVMMAFFLWLWRKLHLQKLSAKIIALACFTTASFFPIVYLEPPVLNKSVQTEPFSQALVEKYQREKIPFFVNVTASWCITCKYNELTLNGASAEGFFNQKEIHYLEADWTNQNTEITNFLEQFGRSGVPLYVYYPANAKPVVLPQLLSFDILKATIETADKEPR